MKIILSITTDNAAFDDENEGPEVARILRALADEFEGDGIAPDYDASLRDINGNTCGQIYTAE